MSLYNLTKISSNNPVEILQGFNSYTADFGFSVIALAIYVALFIAIYTNTEDTPVTLILSGFIMTILSTLLFFMSLIPPYVVFLFLSLLVVGIVIKVSSGGE